MRILPVLDIRGGIVVRAVAGRRSDYRSLVSSLTDSTDPLAVAEAIRGKFGWSEFYVADLDAIAAYDLETNLEHYARLRSAGFDLWLDAGIRDAADADLIASQAERVVVGSETLRDLASWREISLRLGPERAVFSLDLSEGRPMSKSFGSYDALEIADRMIADGGRQLIVLDLARVGTGGGPATETLCAELIRRYPGVAVYTGGGIRGWDDVRRMEAIGVAGVLVASALHDGSIGCPTR